MIHFTLSKTQNILNALTDNCRKAVTEHIRTKVLPEVRKQVEQEVDQVVADYLAKLTITLQNDPMFNDPKIQFIFPEVTKDLSHG